MDELTDPLSARRIASASDQRRRAVERAMHDGVQQHLALAALKVSLLRQSLRSSPDAAEALCAELVETLASAQRELRELAHTVWPMVLENEGLAAALTEAFGRQPRPIDFRADGVRRHAREIETAIYFCCLEALETIERHAAGTTASVTLRERDGGLDFAVVEHGPGGAPSSVSTEELQHVADRLHALGGRLEITAIPGSGSTIRGIVPLDDAQLRVTDR